LAEGIVQPEHLDVGRCGGRFLRFGRNDTLIVERQLFRNPLQGDLQKFCTILGSAFS
jgi:hypothetical protein